MYSLPAGVCLCVYFSIRRFYRILWCIETCTEFHVCHDGVWCEAQCIGNYIIFSLTRQLHFVCQYTTYILEDNV